MASKSASLFYLIQLTVQFFTWEKSARSLIIQINYSGFVLSEVTAVSYYAFPCLVAIKRFTEMPYSESIQASSCVESSGNLVTSF